MGYYTFGFLLRVGVIVVCESVKGEECGATEARQKKRTQRDSRVLSQAKKK